MTNGKLSKVFTLHGHDLLNVGTGGYIREHHNREHHNTVKTSIYEPYRKY